MEGKEVRFGIANSMLFTTGHDRRLVRAVNNMHDSLLPLAGAVPLVNILLGEIIFAASARVSTACCCSPSWRCSSPV